ncbi:MAG TPA: phosphate signaling complex protein PhoU [Aeromicrobium sp.]|nr:phosphate signaling complex protein PhoU [Aeromicrobium sp.]
MRDAYYEQLQGIVDDVVRLAASVRRALSTATLALLDGDGRMAELAIRGDDALDQMTRDIEDRAITLMATQQPVASDLRQLVVTLRMIADLERMGDLAVHIAKVARMREPGRAVPDKLETKIRAMARVADSMIETASRVVAERDIIAAAELEREDDEMDHLRKDLFRKLLGSKWPHGVEAAVDIALLGRYYERIGDHAVSMARRLVFQVTGERELI